MMLQRGGRLHWLWLSGLVILLDRWTKHLAEAGLRLHDPVPVVPGFKLTLMYNKGAAFSLLSDAGGWQRWFFVVLALGVSVGIVFWLRRLGPGERWSAAGLSLILGGALGNVWDRLTLGQVVDFIQVYYERWYWPAFNMADSAITVGAAILVIHSLFGAPRGRSEG